MVSPKRFAAFLLLIVPLLAAGSVLWRDRTLRLLYVDQEPLLVGIADTEAERTLGLSYRSKLANGHGMLFAFDEPSATCMWMKDMKFPIDVYWFSANGRLVSYSQGVYPSSFPAVYCPNGKASYMLEVNIGELKSLPQQLAVPKQ